VTVALQYGDEGGSTQVVFELCEGCRRCAADMLGIDDLIDDLIDERENAEAMQVTMRSEGD
jgi:hypothetical protein